MNDLANYKRIAENIFGRGTTTFDVTTNHTNKIIGALNHTGYEEFRDCFIARLKRLDAIYNRCDSNRKNLIDRTNLIASNQDSNWQGAYSELAAFDFLNKGLLEDNTYSLEPITLDYNLDNHRTFADELGRATANVDGRFPEYDVYFDVKSLKDNVTEILKRVYEEVKNRLGYSDFYISAEYSLDMPYDHIQRKRGELIKELCNRIDTTEKTTYVQSNVISNLGYRLLWGKGALVTEGTYNPYAHAEQHHQLAFRAASKFVKDRPFFLVFVVFPWFNGIIRCFRDQNREFYRAFARRAFCQYIQSKQLYNCILSKFSGSQTIFEVSRKLSGILFLEDLCIKSKIANGPNVRSYSYLNPNADNNLSSTLFIDYFLSLGNSVFDDFQYDNY